MTLLKARQIASKLVDGLNERTEEHVHQFKNWNRCRNQVFLVHFEQQNL